jgi:multiple sugar transport system permease protein
MRNNVVETTPQRERAGVRLARTSRLRLGPAQLVAHGFLIVVTITILMPFVWLVLGSFKTYADLTSNQGLPRPWTLANYYEIFSRTNIALAILNSVIVSVGRVIFVCITSVTVGYVFAKYRFPGRELLFGILLSTLMVPFAVILVPLYVTLSELKLLNSLTGLIAVSIYSTFGIFFLRQTIRDISNDYIEAARIDGASELWILLRIILPLSKTALSALAVFTFLFSWDDFLFPSIVLTDPNIKTLPLVLAGLRALYWDRYELYAAGSMLTVVPVMVLYALMQKQFVRGITMGGVKG